ncbi:hypothetical protein ACIBBG_26785 [Micromonospora chersina]|uniref:hypothetical protein n=1 Tax=Micromonospora chersina TaxID=47854 RepID=UPI0037B71A07
MTGLDAATTERALAALTSGQETFTRDQVAYLLALAFQVGADATLDEQAEDPVAVELAYRAGFAAGEERGYDGALAEVWEGIRFLFSGPRRAPDHRNGIRGNLTARDAVWWHLRAVDQRDARRQADAVARIPRKDDYLGGPVNWETGQPVHRLETAA